MLQTAHEHYARQQRIQAAAHVNALRAYRRHDLKELSRVVVSYQAVAAADAIRSVPLMLAEQGIDAEAVGTVQPLAFAGRTASGYSLLQVLSDVTSEFQLGLILSTELADASRMAGSVSTVARPKVGGLHPVSGAAVMQPLRCPGRQVLPGQGGVSAASALRLSQRSRERGHCRRPDR